MFLLAPIQGTAVARMPPLNLGGGSDSVVLVEARHRDAFLKEAETLGLRLEEGGTVSGLNYSRGDPVAVALYRAARR